MNADSRCARWRTHHWDCQPLDSLIDPCYFSPPIPPDGKPCLSVTAFHASIPRAGYVFTRTALGEPWVRTA